MLFPRSSYYSETDIDQLPSELIFQPFQDLLLVCLGCPPNLPQ